MPQISRDDLIRTLLRPEAYPWNPTSVELVETHMSWVFLAGDRVVKIKRPVRFGFVDHSGIGQRRFSCEEEVRLNRRLTDGVYLGTVPVGRHGDRLVVGGEGEPFDWATLMRCLPAERMLDSLLSSGSAPGDLADLLARRLIPFHREAAPRCDRGTGGSEAAVRAVVTSNLDELRAFAGGPIGAVQFALVEEAMRAFLVDNAPLLRRRVSDGWVREGHGDLRTEHICLDGGVVQIFDCVEFSRAIRCADVASDLAFLLMDLGRLGAESIGSGLKERYNEARIDLPPPLVRFYRAHRALVRAKIDCLTIAEGLRPHPGLASAAAVHLDLATLSSLTVRPFVIAMTGLSGTGKSTVAAAIARATGADMVASDVVRKELAGVTGSCPAGWGEGLYGAEWNERTYERLLAVAAESLGAGRPAVLDATFLDERWRERAVGLASAASAPFLLVETVCDEQLAAARIAARSAGGRSASDADIAVHDRQRAMRAGSPVAVPSGVVVVRVDTGTEAGGRLDPVFAALNKAGVLRTHPPAGLTWR
ncbi:MAG: AAA family ATPase [Thermomicrobiales bacterium]